MDQSMKMKKKSMGKLSKGKSKIDKSKKTSLPSKLPKMAKLMKGF